MFKIPYDPEILKSCKLTKNQRYAMLIFEKHVDNLSSYHLSKSEINFFTEGVIGFITEPYNPINWCCLDGEKWTLSNGISRMKSNDLLIGLRRYYMTKKVNRNKIYKTWTYEIYIINNQVHKYFGTVIWCEKGDTIYDYLVNNDDPVIRSELKVYPSNVKNAIDFIKVNINNFNQFLYSDIKKVKLYVENMVVFIREKTVSSTWRFKKYPWRQFGSKHQLNVHDKRIILTKYVDDVPQNESINYKIWKYEIYLKNDIYNGTLFWCEQGVNHKRKYALSFDTNGQLFLKNDVVDTTVESQ